MSRQWKAFIGFSAAWVALFAAFGVAALGLSFEYAGIIAVVTYVIPFGGMWCSAVLAWEWTS